MQDWKEEARHKILSEAQHLFLERGYDRTSLQMIAEKAGVSKGRPVPLFHQQRGTVL